MSGLKFVKIDAPILDDDSLSAAEKILLGVFAGFPNKGARLSNEKLGRAVGLGPDRVSEILAGLAAAGRVKIVNPKSPYRQIFYCGLEAGVNQHSTTDFPPSTSDSTPFHCGPQAEHNIINKNNYRGQRRPLSTAAAAEPKKAAARIAQIEREKQLAETLDINKTIGEQHGTFADYLKRKNAQIAPGP